MRKLQHGGDLHPGDFIAIAEQNHMSFGWYFGDGRGTLQYFYYTQPRGVEEYYEEWTKLSDEAKKRDWRTTRFKNGFTVKSIYKSYVNAVHKTRVIKLNNPEEIFTDPEDREYYEKSKEALIKLNFLKP